MIVYVDQDGTCRLAEPDVMTTLAVERASLDQSKVSCGSWDDDGAHLWIDAAWLRTALGNDPQRQSALEGMLRYAGSNGWINDTGSVRGHVSAD